MTAGLTSETQTEIKNKNEEVIMELNGESKNESENLNSKKNEEPKNNEIKPDISKEDKDTLSKHLLNILAICEKQFSEELFVDQCVLIATLGLDKTEFVKHWQSTKVPPLNGIQMIRIFSDERITHLLAECQNYIPDSTYNYWAETCGSYKESYLYYLMCCIHVTSTPPQRTWYNYTDMVHKSVIKKLKKLYNKMVSTTGISGIIAGGKIVRLILGIDGGDIDFFITGIYAKNKKLKDIPPLSDGASRVGNCITSKDSKYQYISMLGKSPQDIVKAFDMSHLEMYFNGEELIISNAAELGIKFMKSYPNYSYLEARRAEKYNKMGFSFPDGTLIITNNLGRPK